MNENRKEDKNSVTANAGQAKPKRILLADDNEIILNLVSGFLEFIGYEVARAIDGVEALSAFLASSFDLVLTDLEMPAMDGLSLAGRIKEKSPNTPVILITGSDRETVLRKVENGPVDSVIFKPFMMEDLQRTVEVTLASGELYKYSDADGVFSCGRKMFLDQRNFRKFRSKRENMA